MSLTYSENPYGFDKKLYTGEDQQTVDKNMLPCRFVTVNIRN